MSSMEFNEMITTIRPTLADRRASVQRHPRRSGGSADPAVLESIVVPVDGTAFAEHAIPLAVAIARHSGATVKLVRAFTSPKKGTLHRMARGWDTDDSRLRTAARRDLDRIRRRIAARVRDVSVVTCLSEAATVVDAIGRVSKAADLVIMASHGRSWLGRFFLGSVARDLLRSRRKPMIIVRGYDAPVDYSADPVPQHLAIGLDGRKSSEAVLKAAGLVARFANAKTTLIHVDDPGEFDERFAHSSPEGYLRWTAQVFAKSVPEVSTHVVRNAASPTHGLLKFAEESDADLIAVASRSTPPAFGSITENLLRSSRVPVLVVGE